MIYDKTNYNFTSNNAKKDDAPEWMDSFFHEVVKPKEKVNLSGVFNIKQEKHFCEKCANELNENEVELCMDCLTKN